MHSIIKTYTNGKRDTQQLGGMHSTKRKQLLNRPIELISRIISTPAAKFDGDKES